MHAPRAGQCLDLPGACEHLVPEGLTADLLRSTMAGFVARLALFTPGRALAESYV